MGTRKNPSLTHYFFLYHRMELNETFRESLLHVHVLFVHLLYLILIQNNLGAYISIHGLIRLYHLWIWGQEGNSSLIYYSKWNSMKLSQNHYYMFFLCTPILIFYPYQFGGFTYQNMDFVIYEYGDIGGDSSLIHYSFYTTEWN